MCRPEEISYPPILEYN